MKINKMIEKLNQSCDGSLVITHLLDGWEISSHLKGTLFYKQPDRIIHSDFDTAIRIAYSKTSTLTENEKQIIQKAESIIDTVSKKLNVDVNFSDRTVVKSWIIAQLNDVFEIGRSECYDWFKKEIHKIIAYPTKEQGRRTNDGYPSELVYDEFAYKRIVDSYRKSLENLLKIFKSKNLTK